MLTRAEIHTCPPDPSGTGPFLLSSVALHGTLLLRCSERALDEAEGGTSLRES